MCGISGIIASKNIAEDLVKAIQNLEYRGYDSCGVAILGPEGIQIRKDIGTVEEVNQREALTDPIGKVGIAHTRWATHGGVAKTNAHPHISCQGDFALVHNGIISNYRELREELVKEGHCFRSETDTEAIVHLLEKFFQQTADLEEALIRTLKQLEGSYALAIISIHQPDKIFCARKESPLILGVGQEANYIGSDFNAFIEFTRNAIVLEDGEYAILDKDHYVVKNTFTREIVSKEILTLHWDIESAKKGGFPHYMLKEIFEQPQSITQALQIDPAQIRKLAHLIADSHNSYLVGVGTTYYVSLVGQYYFAKLAGHYISCISSDEFWHLAQVDKNSLVLVISQSGETYDTINTIKYAKSHGATTAAITNVIGSSIARMVDLAIMQGSGPEICVISTKAALAQMIILIRVALQLTQIKKVLKPKAVASLEQNLWELPGAIKQILNTYPGLINKLARKNWKVKNWLYLGRGVYYPIALEAALKMKEVAYLHAEGMPAGFLKHGTLALIDEEVNTVGFIPPREDEELYQPTISSMEEVRARGGYIIGFHFDEGAELFQDELLLPKVPSLIAPLTQLVAAQLLAYYTASVLQRNIDKPRSLAKSVTVA
jgi:glucosamine--fructose-6-phosphate aminotransferase (isomerizing)